MSTSGSNIYNYAPSQVSFKEKSVSATPSFQIFNAAAATPLNVFETAYPGVVTSSGTVNSIANDLIQINYASRPSIVATGAAVVPAQAPSQVEEAIYRSVNPPALAGSEVVSVAGHTGLWTNKHEIESWRGDIPLSQYVIHNDAAPQIVRKKPAQNVLYNQEIAVRYLNPPNPAPHGDIVIKEQPNIPTGPAPPIVLRQEPPRPVTPPALILREAPPRAPSPLPPKFLAIPGKRIPPPPRKVVVEKLPILPSKPQSIFIERWLPFKEQTRRVVFERNTVPDPIVQIPKNVIVQWESPDVTVKKEFKDLGIANADPIQYAQTYNAQLKTAQEFPDFVRAIRPPSGVILASEYRRLAVPRLVGDVQALNLIDLDRAGLSEYKTGVSSYVQLASAPVEVVPAAPVVQVAQVPATSFVQAAPVNSTFQAPSSPVPVAASNVVSIDSLLGSVFQNLQVTADGFVTLQDAEHVLLDLNDRFGRSYNEADLRSFFEGLNVSRDGLINFDEFSRSLYNQIAYFA